MRNIQQTSRVVVFLDTSDSEKTSLSVFEGRHTRTTRTYSRRILPRGVLLLLSRVLQERGLTVHDISEIRVVTGPGSFTGLRVGVAIANALGWLLGIPVNGKRGHIVQPKYGAPPAIHVKRF